MVGPAVSQTAMCKIHNNFFFFFGGEKGVIKYSLSLKCTLCIHNGLIFFVKPEMMVEHCVLLVIISNSQNSIIHGVARFISSGT